ncbi:MAG: hypothetical protein Q8L34_03250 [Candidatus Woesearchaeota archaeon]|nr:hypothetical protein [Candidatus Woesearchaeota archaeon]
MDKKPELDALLYARPFGDGSYSSTLVKILIDAIRSQTKLFQHSDRYTSFPVTKSIPWSRLQRYADDGRFQQCLIARLNEFSANGLVCIFRVYPAPSNAQGIRGYLVFESKPDPQAMPLEELGLDKIAWPKF